MSDDSNSQFIFKDHRKDPPIIKSDKGESVPTFFMNFGGRQVHIMSEEGRNTFGCPRCGPQNTIEVNTDAGVWLYCFICKIFYPEFGHWGYKR